MSFSLRLRRASAAGALLAAALFATACDPTDAAPATTGSPAAVSSSAPSPSDSPTPPPSPSPSPSPTPSPTPTPTVEPTTQAPTTKAPEPAPKATTAKPPADPTDAPEQAGCHPLSNAGNCYKAGQFCRASDHGVVGTDASGRTIRCEDKNGWRWVAG